MLLACANLYRLNSFNNNFCIYLLSLPTGERGLKLLPVVAFCFELGRSLLGSVD